ncbi:GIY-YIG nuclease family protein [Mycobacterium marinum]|uniref:GIY-YIG nuclease family protein n=1 Tax=Mycobacterium marinum TaxID=1781 RepID=UPI001922585C|nr:GIY-YIG nuclease family protein [Mycobacterium marinum]QQW33209.1 GIY-YIG nuclease family protein [Mycobacterium marinum]
MAVAKDEILAEIRRCAAENGGVPLGMPRFEAETGIRQSDWRGRYWVTWNDALSEAGFAPNAMQGRKLNDDELLRYLALLTRKLGRFPTYAHLCIESRNSRDFPGESTFKNRIGNKAEQVARLRQFTASDEAFADVYELLPMEVKEQSQELAGPVATTQADGVVYMVKSGRYYKIGRTSHVGRRSYEIGLQLPEKPVPVHSFETDDPVGIEGYWHQRFKDRRRNGEWFLLTKADVAAFKRRRRFM